MSSGKRLGVKTIIIIVVVVIVIISSLSSSIIMDIFNVASTVSSTSVFSKSGY